MKMVFFLGVFLMSTLLSFGQSADKKAPSPKSEQKKERHVKVMISQNGKVTKIDTTFNMADEKMVKLKVDSILKKLNVVDGKDGNAEIVIIKGDNKMMHWEQKSGNHPGEQEIRVFYQEGDSGTVKHQKKVVRISHGGGDMAVFGPDGALMPPPPPPPPMPAIHMRSFKMAGGDPFAMDPNNKDIISYDKKDIGKGLEKITIVRKKQTPHPDAKEVEMKVEVTDKPKK